MKYLITLSIVTGLKAVNKLDCEKARGYMAEYIEDTLETSVREEVACHLDMCDSCFGEIKNIDKTMWNLEESSRNVKTPPGFLYNMDEEILEKYNPRAKAFRRMLKRAAYVFAVLSAVLIVVLAYRFLVPLSMKYRLTNILAMGKAYSYSDGTFGRKLNISSTSQNIKVTVEKVAADDMQTMIYFKTEGSGKGTYMAFIKSDSVRGGVVKGSSSTEEGFILYLLPIYKDEITLDISFSSMYINDEAGGITNPIEGTWSFKVPVRKINSKVYNINRTVNIDGYYVNFNKLTTGPTGTKLDISYTNRSPESTYFMVNGANLQIQSKVYNPKYTMIANTSTGNQVGGSFSMTFEAIYPETPKGLSLNIKSYHETLKTQKPVEVPINLNGEFPVKFDYLGSTITIDNLNIVDDKIQFEIIEPLESRNYGIIDLMFMDMDKNPINSATAWDEAVVIDSNGVKYDRDEVMKNIEKYRDKQLSWYPVRTTVSLKPDNKDIKTIILEAQGHTNFKWINQKVELR